jgi:response regulator RpfG family c-di-GMP phosphodiesterase
LKRQLLTAAALAGATLLAEPAHADGAPLSGWRVERRTTESGLPTAPVRALVADAGGWLWVGTGAGLLRFDGERFRAVPLAPTAAPAVYALAEGAGDELWVASEAGVAIVDRATLAIQALPSPGPVYALARGAGGSFWLGTPRGLLHWRDGAVAARFGAADGLPDAEVRALAVEVGGTLLAGTPRGVARLDGARFQALSPIATLALAVAPGGGAVAAGPLAAVDLASGEPLVTARPLTAGAVLARAALLDAEGALWLAGDRLARRRAGAATLDLVAGDEAGALHALAADGAGGIWAGGETGLVHLAPPQPRPPAAPPSARLERVEVDGREIAAGPSGYVLPAGGGRLELVFAAGGAAAPAAPRLRHRLVGAEEAWHDSGARRAAVYERLPAGSYRFEVMAAFGDGPWGAPVTAGVEIAPRWHERFAVRLAAALALLALAALLVRWRLTSLGRRQTELEAEVAARTAELARLNDELAARVAAQTGEVRRTRDQALLTLARLAELRDGTTGEHLDRIAWFSRRLAEAIADGPFGPLGEEFVEELFRSSPLHDIGKVAIPDAILTKPGALDARERGIMERHTTIGGDTLRGVIARSPGQSFLAMGMEIAYAHHERWDGRGYPRRLAGEQIPLAARIVALVDAYDAITALRPYKDAIAHDEAVRRILADAGTHFDPRLTDAFRRNHADLDRLRREHPSSG